MIYLSGFRGFYSYNGQQREAQCLKQTEEGFICFLGILFVFDFQSEISISNKEGTKRDKEPVGWFCLVCFSLHDIFLFSVPNSETECLALRGEAEGEFFLTFPGVSWVLYFFGVQKPCRDIIREFTGRDHAKGPEQNLLCSTRQAS